MPTRRPTGGHRVGGSPETQPSTWPPLTRLALLPESFRLLMAGGGGRKNIQQTIAKVMSEQEGGRERWGCQIRRYSLETLTTMAGIFNHDLLNPNRQRDGGLGTSRNQQGAAANLSMSWDKTLRAPSAGVSSIFWAVTWAEDKAKHNKRLPAR